MILSNARTNFVLCTSCHSRERERAFKSGILSFENILHVETYSHWIPTKIIAPNNSGMLKLKFLYRYLFTLLRAFPPEIPYFTITRRRGRLTGGWKYGRQISQLKLKPSSSKFRGSTMCVVLCVWPRLFYMQHTNELWHNFLLAIFITCSVMRLAHRLWRFYHTGAIVFSSSLSLSLSFSCKHSKFIQCVLV